MHLVVIVCRNNKANPPPGTETLQFGTALNRQLKLNTLQEGLVKHHRVLFTSQDSIVNGSHAISSDAQYSREL